MPFRHLVGIFVLTLGLPASAGAASFERLDVTVRGRTLNLAVYHPQIEPRRGTVVMGSGDVGWVGLAVAMAETLSEQGYLVVGVNIRQYLSLFTSGSSHLEVGEAPGDFHTISDVLQERRRLALPVILSGVSGVAGLAVLAPSDGKNHEGIDGVTAGVEPMSAQLA